MSDFSFSKRTQWAFQENQLSSVIDDLKKQGVSIFDLTQSNPTECAFEYPQELLSALTSQENLHYAPQSKGYHLPARRLERTIRPRGF
jgi:hypothetical protein